MEVIFILIGISTGLVLGFLIAKSMYQKNTGINLSQYDNLSQKLTEVTAEKAKSEAERSSLIQRLQEQKNEIEQLQKKFTAEFENLANKIFSEKTKESRQNIEDILKPLREELKDFERKVDEAYDKETRDKISLREEVKRLFELNSRISAEANNLTKALKGDTKAQGNWGEFILESVLEKSGLERNREYFVQQTYRSDEGKMLRPDVIVKLPEEKNLVIDSKVSLTAYEQFCNVEDENEKKKFISEHIVSIKKHIKDLSPKDYQNLYKLNSLDFVLMFIAVEPAFAVAVKYDAEIFSEAFEKNIVIVSPSTLLATLRTIASIWKQEKQNRNALEIAKQGGALYDQFCSFLKDLEDVGNSIRRTKDSYENAMKRLTEGRGNLIARTENLKQLGAKTTKSIEQKWQDRAGQTLNLPEN